MTHQTIPVINLQPLDIGGTQRQNTVRQVGEACCNWGFFQIIGHGVPDDLIACVWRETKGFFALPTSVKNAAVRTRENARGWYNRELTKNSRDMKEVFDFGYKPYPELPDEDSSNWTRDGYNQWPDLGQCADFQSTMWEYFQACERIAFALLEVIGEGLGVAPGSLAQDFLDTHTSFLRLNYFPKHDPIHLGQQASAAGHLGIHHHTDAGALTVLVQDNVGGLQVCLNNEWIPVDPVDGALVINIGDMVQVWSNDRYQAPLHRVLASENRDRYSLPFFFNPSYDAKYAPLDVLINEASPPKYRPINWGEFRWQRQQGDYANYGQENQIADYRIPHVSESQRRRWDESS
ncbi:isopenicillin N synthase family dioxygenase [Nitrospira sp. M1]